MVKTNKELAVEIVVAAINANPKLPFGNEHTISKPMSKTEIVGLLQDVYKALESLSDNETK